MRRELERFSRSMVSCLCSSSTSPAPVWLDGWLAAIAVFVARAGKLSFSSNEQEIHWGYNLRYWMLPSIYFSAAYRVLLSLVVVFVLTSIDGLGHLADVSRPVKDIYSRCSASSCTECFLSVGINWQYPLVFGLWLQRNTESDIVKCRG